MLPKQVADLTEGFVRVFDSERPAVMEFRKAHNQAAAWKLQSGMGWGGAIIKIGESIKVYLEDRARFIWSKTQEVVASTGIDDYPELNSDLKLLIATHYNPARQGAERYVDELRQSVSVPTGYTVETKSSFANILTKIDAEVDLFCAAYTANKKAGRQPSGPTFNNFTGVYGNVTNSRVDIHDYSSIYQLLVERNIPKHERRELEDLMEELKDASPEARPVLLEQGEKWLSAHKVALGAGAENVAKAIGR